VLDALAIEPHGWGEVVLRDAGVGPRRLSGGSVRAALPLRVARGRRRGAAAPGRFGLGEVGLGLDVVRSPIENAFETIDRLLQPALGDPLHSFGQPVVDLLLRPTDVGPQGSFHLAGLFVVLIEDRDTGEDAQRLVTIALVSGLSRLAEQVTDAPFELILDRVDRRALRRAGLAARGPRAGGLRGGATVAGRQRGLGALGLERVETDGLRLFDFPTRRIHLAVQNRQVEVQCFDVLGRRGPSRGDGIVLRGDRRGRVREARTIAHEPAQAQSFHGTLVLRAQGQQLMPRQLRIVESPVEIVLGGFLVKRLDLRSVHPFPRWTRAPNTRSGAETRRSMGKRTRSAGNIGRGRRAGKPPAGTWISIR
jgi:hypothetical protein